MKRFFSFIAALLCALCLAGCGPVGDKAASATIVYAVMAVLSVALLLCYCFLTVSKNSWYLLLFASVLIVNCGYFSLSVSQALSEALLANRISYLGSVFLPLSMLMIILDSCGIRCRRWICCLLVALSFFMFFISASPGYLDIYYSSVSLQVSGGVSSLAKVYGSWHSLYLFYLLGYFGSMLAVILFSIRRRRLASTYHSVFLLIAVLVNIGVWLLEQLVRFDFEFLSVSYVTSELFLLGLSLILQENQRTDAAAVPQAPVSCAQEALPEAAAVAVEEPAQLNEQCRFLSANLCRLTSTERCIYELYLQGMSTRQVLDELSITENTLKYHNKNLYSKLGVSSRKQLLEIAAVLQMAGISASAGSADRE